MNSVSSTVSMSVTLPSAADFADDGPDPFFFLLEMLQLLFQVGYLVLDIFVLFFHVNSFLSAEPGNFFCLNMTIVCEFTTFSRFSAFLQQSALLTGAKIF